MKFLFLILSLQISVYALAQDDFDFGETEFEESLMDSTTELTEDIDFSEEEEEDFNNPLPQQKARSSKSSKYIYHPNQEKGLYKINRSGEYLYNYDKSKAKSFLSLRGGQLNFENFPQDSATLKFKDYYDKNKLLAFVVEYDWEPFKKHRALSVKLSGGFAFANGKGRFSSAQNGSTESKQKYSFVLFPMSAGLTYKFKLVQDQLFLPYVTGALDYSMATEFRKGFKNFKFNGILGAHFGGGLNINLGWLERSAALQLDQDFGINNVYLSLEARQMISFDTAEDINGTIFLAGLSFEY